MQFFAIKTPLIKPNDNLIDIILNSINLKPLKLANGDILVIAETPISITQDRIIKADEIKEISPISERLANKYKMSPIFTQIIIEEADVILGGVEGVLLTEKDGILIANAGVDQSNSGGENKYVLFPKDPQQTAKSIREQIIEKTGLEDIGIIIADSRVQPMKRGTIGVAIAVSGIEPIDDCRGKKDLFGRPLEITTRALADNIVSGSQILMGEADEQIPVVLVRNVPVKFTNRSISTEEMIMARDECLFMNVFKDLAVYKKPEYMKPTLRRQKENNEEQEKE
ncbi:MAG: coenzyme F420-0:L-glutamate ligase [Candidatus Lokiarchaeota archaeon]|nr:coenzyme F420-0:L-glutamate ligase [Candidatus Lokiarchaeota archaeon]